MAASQTNLRSQSLNAYSLPLHTAREAMGPGKGMLQQQPEEENKLRIDPEEVGDHMPNINSQGSNKNKSNTNLKTTEAKLEDHGGENNYYALRSQFMLLLCRQLYGHQNQLYAPPCLCRRRRLDIILQKTIPKDERI